MNREKDTAVAASRVRDGAAFEAGLKTYRKLMSIDHDFSDEYLIMAIMQDGLKAADELTPPKALTVNTSTPGNGLEYNELAATRDKEIERRLTRLEFEVSLLKGGKE